MNEVLRVFMHGRLAGVIRGADTMDYFKRGRDVHDGDRPLWGDTGRVMDGDPPATRGGEAGGGEGAAARGDAAASGR